jgi:lipoate---protein ligase
MKPWQRITEVIADGQTQMAIDNALLDAHIAGERPSMLRFYRWPRPTLSLGYHQRDYPAHWNQVIWQGEPLPIVRRPTGGRGVLHQGDLTYAVITSGLKPGRRESYAQICRFLIEGFGQLGLDLGYGAAGRGYIHQPDCFGTATAADLVLPDGSKLIGSAQLRRGDAVLQHGSIRLNPDAGLYQQVFGDQGLRLPQVAAGLRSGDRVALVLGQAAKNCFGGDWQTAVLNPEDYSPGAT